MYFINLIDFCFLLKSSKTCIAKPTTVTFFALPEKTAVNFLKNLKFLKWEQSG